MALTQKFPDFELSLPIKEVLAALPSPQEVKNLVFKKGGDVDQLAAIIGLTAHAVVEAAPGAGKSTRLPQAVAASHCNLVLHVLPFPQLAASVHRWHSAQKGYVKPYLLESLSQLVPTSGYVITHASLVVAMWLSKGVRSLAGATVLHDESHESGAASGVLRSLSPHAGFKSYVTMSATHSVDSFRPYEASGKVVCKMYEPDAFDDPWSVMDEGAPWAASKIESAVLIIEDDNRRAASLVKAYNTSNVVAFRWTCDTPTDIFLSNLDFMEANPRCRFAIVADSTYRSGYTLPVDGIFDSGFIRRTVSRPDGGYYLRSRPIYSFERYQTSARGGRLEGLTTRYYSPVAVPENKMCVLEQVDAEAYVLLLRLLGFSAGDSFKSARFYSGKVPKDVLGALNGDVPLAVLDEFQTSEIGELCVKHDPSEISENLEAPFDADETDGDVVGNDHFDFKQMARDIEEITEVHEPEAARFGFPILNSTRHEALSPADLALVSESTRRYASEGMLDNVLKFVWEEDDLLMNFSVAAAKYNQHLARMLGVSSALKKIKQAGGDKDRTALTAWARDKGELLVLAQAEMKLWFGIAELIARDRYQLVKGPNFSKHTLDEFSNRVYHTYNLLPDRMKPLDYTRVYADPKALNDGFERKLRFLD